MTFFGLCASDDSFFVLYRFSNGGKEKDVLFFEMLF